MITSGGGVDINVSTVDVCKTVSLQLSGAAGDALATAVVVLGKEKGVKLLEQLGVKGVLITSDLKCVKVGEFDLEVQ